MSQRAKEAWPRGQLIPERKVAMYILEPVRTKYAKLTVFIHDSTSQMAERLNKAKVDFHDIPSLEELPERIYVPVTKENTPHLISAQKWTLLKKSQLLLSDFYPTAERWAILVDDDVITLPVEYK